MAVHRPSRCRWLCADPALTKQLVFSKDAPAQAAVTPIEGADPPFLRGVLSGCGLIRDPLALEGPDIKRYIRVEKDRMFSAHFKLTTVLAQSSALEKRGR